MKTSDSIISEHKLQHQKIDITEKKSQPSDNGANNELNNKMQLPSSSATVTASVSQPQVVTSTVSGKLLHKSLCSTFVRISCRYQFMVHISLKVPHDIIKERPKFCLCRKSMPPMGNYSRVLMVNTSENNEISMSG